MLPNLSYNPAVINTYTHFINQTSYANVIYQEPPQEVKTAIFYLNDLHGSKIDRCKSASDTFTKGYQSDPTVDTFKLSAGDLSIGKDEGLRNLVIESMNLMGIDLSTIGNHETDAGTSVLAKEIDKAKFKFITTNLNISSDSELYSNVKNQKIIKSWIINRNGHNYGFIGASPVDFFKTRSTGEIKGLSIDDLNKAIKDIQQEADNLSKKGINKIILISHLGYKDDLTVAKNTTGIDVIIGGHSHDIIKGLQKGANLVTSKTGEPVIITQAGKDGEYFGILNVIFNQQGKIISAHNAVNSTGDYPKDKTIRELKDKYLGKEFPVGILSKTCKPTNTFTTENPLAEFILDAMRQKAGLQFIIENSGAIRGQLDAGVITTRDIKELVPFSDKLYKVKLSEKTLIEALDTCAKTTKKFPYKPGLMQVSGLKYTVTPDGSIKDVFIENPDKSYTQINHINPNPNKYYITLLDEYLLKGLEFPMLHNVEILEEYPWSREDATIEYIKKLNNKPFEIKINNRINIQKAPEQIPDSKSYNPFLQQKLAAFR